MDGPTKFSLNPWIPQQWNYEYPYIYNSFNASQGVNVEASVIPSESGNNYAQINIEEDEERKRQISGSKQGKNRESQQK